MWDLLNWLWGVATKVYDWFGETYWNLRYAANNAWNWAVSQANIAYNNAVAYAHSLIMAVQYYASDLVSALRNTVNGWISSIYTWVTQGINDVRGFINNQVQWVLITAQAAVLAAENTVRGWVNSAIQDLINRINAAIKSVNDYFAPLVALISQVNKILSLVSDLIFGKIQTLAGSAYNGIISFTDDPVGFILGVIWSSFILYLTYALAYAMGTVQADLPPVPAWGKGMAGNNGGTDPPIPPNSQGLQKPITPLYISGYTFSATHPGNDYGLVMGQSIFAAHDGTVSYAGWDSSGYGNRLDITGNPWWSRYGHTQQILVSVGQSVKRGQLVAYGDSTGNSTGPHLHFELKLSGSYVDSVKYL